MNILNKQSKALSPNPNATPSIKREKFNWAQPCNPGVFMMIKKEELNIDGTYQRDEVSKDKVLAIARDWDWKLFGVVSLIRRKDDTYWVFDGGHRTRAAFYRDDIMSLPCMVFEADNEKDEAKAFVGTNTMKSSVSAYHKHRAAVKTGEPIAVASEAIVVKFGYMVDQSTKRKYCFAAINTLQAQVKEDRILADRVFSACARIAQDGEQISGEVLDAVFLCQKKLQGRADITAGAYLERMRRETLPGIDAAIRREKHIVGRGGSVVAAKALLDVLNKGKRRRLAFP